MRLENKGEKPVLRWLRIPILSGRGKSSTVPEACAPTPPGLPLSRGGKERPPHRRLPPWCNYWPEVLLAILACAVFLGFLGSVNLWGKREQAQPSKRSTRSTTITGWWPSSRAPAAREAAAAAVVDGRRLLANRPPR